MMGIEDYEIAEPHASIMIESLRAFGYDLKTAIADLLDNSITADAENIWLDFHWSGSNSYIKVTDDGKGMTSQRLFEAMRPGSKNPLEEREAKDLGRFGLGLKTASFSQCKRLTVASKPNGEQSSVRRWDLEFVAKTDKWSLLKTPAKGSENHFVELNEMKHGTIVLWELLDRVVGNSNRNDRLASEQFYKSVKAVEDYISMVFHRYLEGSRPQIKVYLNGKDESHRILSWNPFAESSSATVYSPDETIPFASGTIGVKGFVLPHKDKLEPEEYSKLSGPEGWTAQQGFYVYRNKRLLIPGSWLGLGEAERWTKQAQYNLARIRIDIPNSLDIDWQIDVKKSTASPPIEVRGRLRDLAAKVRKEARQVFAFRGEYGPSSQKKPLQRIWQSSYAKGSYSYKIDRKHPLVKQVLETDVDLKPLIESLLVTIEETVPIQQIWLDSAERSEESARPFQKVDEDSLSNAIEFTYSALRKKEGLTPDTARQYLVNTDAFIDYPDAIDAVITSVEAKNDC